MGKRYVEHSDMCGCERCALQWEKERPGKVYDVVEDPDYCDGCGSHVDHCNCAYWDAFEDEILDRSYGEDQP